MQGVRQFTILKLVSLHSLFSEQVNISCPGRPSIIMVTVIDFN